MFPRIFCSPSSPHTPPISRPLTPIEVVVIGNASTISKVETVSMPITEIDHQNTDKCPFKGCTIVGNHTTIHEPIQDVNDEIDPEKLQMLLNEIHSGFEIIESVKAINKMAETVQNRAKQLTQRYRFDRLQKRDTVIIKQFNTFCSCAFMWHIKNYPKEYQLAKNGKHIFIESPKFVSHRFGYALTVSIDPFGDFETSRIFSSIYVSIHPGNHDPILTWPFTATVIFTVFDQTGTDNYMVKLVPEISTDNLESFVKPTNEKPNKKFGLQQFIKISEMEEGGKFVKNGQIFIGVDFENLPKDF